MINFVLYLEASLRDKEIREFLSASLNIEENSIGDIFTELIVTYELRELGVSDFRYELNINCPEDILLGKNICNNLQIGLLLSSYFRFSVLVSDGSDDPYQWILIKDNEIFLASELDSDQDSISLEDSMLKLSIEKSLKILPNESDLAKGSSKVPYFVSPSTKWLDCKE